LLLDQAEAESEAAANNAAAKTASESVATGSQELESLRADVNRLWQSLKEERTAAAAARDKAQKAAVAAATAEATAAAAAKGRSEEENSLRATRLELVESVSSHAHSWLLQCSYLRMGDDSVG